MHNKHHHVPRPSCHTPEEEITQAGYDAHIEDAQEAVKEGNVEAIQTMCREHYNDPRPYQLGVFEAVVDAACMDGIDRAVNEFNRRSVVSGDGHSLQVESIIKMLMIEQG